MAMKCLDDSSRQEDSQSSMAVWYWHHCKHCLWYCY